MFDQNEFIRNRSQFTAAQMAPYQGMQVAFSFDGKTILGHGATGLEVSSALRAAGITDYVIGYIEPFLTLEPSDVEAAAEVATA